jgi:hypothetical protein
VLPLYIRSHANSERNRKYAVLFFFCFLGKDVIPACHMGLVSLEMGLRLTRRMLYSLSIVSMSLLSLTG